MKKFLLKAFSYGLTKKKKNPLSRRVVIRKSHKLERISSFVNHHIKDFVRTLRSFIKDGSEFMIFLKELPQLDLYHAYVDRQQVL